jgi:hypothetical protein
MSLPLNPYEDGHDATRICDEHLRCQWEIQWDVLAGMAIYILLWAYTTGCVGIKVGCRVYNECCVTTPVP